MFRRTSWLVAIALVVSCLGSASCGSGAVKSNDAEGPPPTGENSATSTPEPTPLPGTPQSTPSPSVTPVPTHGASDVAPSPSPVPEGLEACLGRAPIPGHVDVVGQAPPQVLAGYAPGIYAANADGSGLRYVADVRAWFPAAEASGNFAWSPDGTKIAFMGNRGNGESVIVLDLTTGEMNSFTAPVYVYAVTWDGEDSVIAWGNLSGDPRNAVVRVPLDGSPPVQLFILPSGSGNLAWSPNGQCYALSFQLAGWKNETDIFAKDGSPLTGVSGTNGAVWSADGSTLALECGNGGPFKACVWPLDGSEALREIGNGQPEGWSDDGQVVIAGTWKETGPTSVMLSVVGQAAPISVEGTFAILSRDGVHVAFVRDGNIYVRNLSTGDEVRVTDSIIPYMKQPSWSPDGSTLLFTFNPGDTDIYVANADGSDERLLMSGHAASWSPDGSRIEFAVGEAALGSWGSWYVADVGSGSLVRLGDYSFDDIGNFCWGTSDNLWSPDGRYVVYETENGANVEGGVYLVPSNGSAPPLRIGYGSGPNWSPDGAKLAFTGSTGPPYTCAVFTASVAGGEPVLLAEGQNAAWSPRGDLIAFVSVAEVHVINPDGSGERVVVAQMTSASVPFPGAPYALRWSPDGQKLAFRFTDSADGTGTYVVDIDNPGQARFVTEGYAEGWTPDGQRLVVTRYEGARSISYLVNANGSGEQRFLDGAGVDWSPDGSKILYSR